MFCPHCGTQLKDGTKFCSSCGKATSVANSVQSTPPRPTPPPHIPSFNLPNIGSKSGINFSDSLTILQLVNITLVVLSFIFSLLDIYSVDVLGVYSRGCSLYGDNGFLTFLAVNSYLVSLAGLALPLFFGKKKKIFYLPEKINAITALAWLFTYLILGVGVVSSNAFTKAVADFTISAVGWLFIMTTSGSIALTFIISSKQKYE